MDKKMDSEQGLLDGFIESDELKKAEFEEKLDAQKLESIMSPIYVIWNVNAVIVGG